MKRSSFLPRAVWLALFGLAVIPAVSATIVGLNQIVTPEIQPAGILAMSAQVQHPLIGNSQQLQLELGLTPRFEVAWFQGLTPGEGVFSTELNLVHAGPHLLTVGAVNGSTRGGDPQPVVEYGYYAARDNFILGAIRANRRVALVAASGLSYVVIFSIPLAREKFMLDPSNIQVTALALVIGLTGAALIEANWWIQGRTLGERRQLWRSE